MTETQMDALTAIIHEAIENAAISGLCREGQLEFAVQEARKARPDFSDVELLDLVKLEYEQVANSA